MFIACDQNYTDFMIDYIMINCTNADALCNQWFGFNILRSEDLTKLI